jgi:hypothetical protein
LSHELIVALVFAYDKEEAVEKAKVMFAWQCGDVYNGYLYDYFDTFDSPSFLEARGYENEAKSRWGKLPDAIALDHTEGRELLQCCTLYGEGNSTLHNGYGKYTLYSENGMRINSAELLQAFLTAGLVKFNLEKLPFLVLADVHY